VICENFVCHACLLTFLEWNKIYLGLNSKLLFLVEDILVHHYAEKLLFFRLCVNEAAECYISGIIVVQS